MSTEPRIASWVIGPRARSSWEGSSCYSKPVLGSWFISTRPMRAALVLCRFSAYQPGRGQPSVDPFVTYNAQNSEPTEVNWSGI
jgi:hypothetical protein